LDKLPPVVRSAWALRHVEGFELAEVAAALDISLATVKRKLVEAEAALKRCTDVPKEPLR
jgi:RNA polymerase sigma-70 factor (ECF subfamily)